MGSGKSETRGSCQYQTLINRKNLSMPTVTQETYKPVRSELSHCRQETSLGISKKKIGRQVPGERCSLRVLESAGRRPQRRL